MLSSRLKEVTQVAHLDLERFLISRIKAIDSYENYGELLAKFYTYYSAVEALIDRVYDPVILPDYPLRRKAQAILGDMKSLKASKTYTLSESYLPDISTNASAMGAMYVLEGSTLGGSIIMQLVSKQIGNNNHSGFDFFNGYGADTLKMWQTFKSAIDHQPFTENEHLQVIDTANSTFTTLKRWMEYEHAD